MLVWGLASWKEASKEGPGIHRSGLQRRLGLHRTRLVGPRRPLLYETVAGAGQVSMVAQDRGHSLGWQPRLG